MADDADARERRVRDRQAGDYRPPILVEPQGGPVPERAPEQPGDQDDAEQP